MQLRTLDQNEKRRLDGLVLVRVFTDKASRQGNFGTAADRAAAVAATGTLSWCTAWTGLRETLDDLGALVRAIPARACGWSSSKRAWSSPERIAPLTNLIPVMGASPEFGRALIRERQREGIVRSKQCGAYKRREKKMLTPEPIAELVQRVADGIPRSVRAPGYGVNRETLHQYHRRAKLYGAHARDR